MEYYEKIDYKLSRGFKKSIAIEFLKSQLEKRPYDIFKYVHFKEESYEINDYDVTQGYKLKYEYNNENRDINVFIETSDDYFKKYFIKLEIRKNGNEVNIISKSPKEDTNIFTIRHYIDTNVSTMNKRVKYYGKEEEQIIETRFSLFNEQGDLLNIREEKYDETKEKTTMKH